jgi:hypothetical protein
MELSPDWVVGFVDGEGCFHVSVNENPRTRLGYQVLPEFVVVQHQRDVQVLYALKSFFKCGVVRKNNGDRWCYRVRKLECLRAICEFFVKHPLKTKKNVDRIRFCRVVGYMLEGRHLRLEGLLEIVEIALQMNTGQREALLRIKRDLEAKVKREFLRDCTRGPLPREGGKRWNFPQIGSWALWMERVAFTSA